MPPIPICDGCATPYPVLRFCTEIIHAAMTRQHSICAICYAVPTECPVLSGYGPTGSSSSRDGGEPVGAAILLRARLYGGRPYSASSRVLRHRYAVYGTDIRYAATAAEQSICCMALYGCAKAGRCSRGEGGGGEGGTIPYAIMMSGTDTAYTAMRCPVLRYRLSCYARTSYATFSMLLLRCPTSYSVCCYGVCSTDAGMMVRGGEQGDGGA
eukprot:360846-Rhodomonas_salina.1